MALTGEKKAAKPRRQKAAGSNWKSRIVGHDLVDASALKAHPDNWRIHPESQKNALEAIFGELGWVSEVIVSKKSGRILDGHARVELAAEAGEKVPVAYIEVTEEEEKKVLALYDSVGGLALADDKQLADLVADLDLESMDLDAMLRSLIDESAAMVPADVEEETAEHGSPNKKRNLGDVVAQIKPVLYADQVRTLEEAIRLTGIANRGAALISICQSYINGFVAA